MTERERLIDILNDFPIFHSTMKERWMPQAVERLADHLLANGVIVPPCKVGDMVYLVCKKKYDVDGYGMQWYEDWGIVTLAFRLDMIGNIGKTVFLSREDAEKALKEREDR